MAVPTEVVLVSGGLDSTVAADMYPRATLLFVDYGQPYAKKEIKVVCDLFQDRSVETVSIEGLPENSNIFFPARNLMLASIAAQYGNIIIMGGLKDDHVVDKTPEAFEEMSRILTKQCGRHTVVHSPLWEYCKSELVGRKISVARALRTFSCYEPIDGNKFCLNCPACFRWTVALRANGVDTPVPGKDVTKEYLSKLHTYEQTRIWATLKAINTKKNPVIVIDIDGVLTNETEGFDYHNRTPFKENIKVLQQYEQAGCWIVLYSARRELDRSVTGYWLSVHEVPYHALLLEKPTGFLSVDDQVASMLPTMESFYELTGVLGSVSDN